MRIDDCVPWEREGEYKKFDDIVFGEIGLCGCGYPDSVLDMIQEFLEKKSEERHSIYDEEAEEFAKKWALQMTYYLAYTLDHHGFTEHGTSISGAWITDKGKAFLEMLRKSN